MSVELSKVIEKMDETVEVELSNGIKVQVKKRMNAGVLQDMLEGSKWDLENGIVNGLFQTLDKIIVGWDLEDNGKPVKVTKELCNKIFSFADITKITSNIDLWTKNKEKKNSEGLD